MPNALRDAPIDGKGQRRFEGGSHMSTKHAQQPHAISADVLIANTKTIRIAMRRDDET